MIDILHHNDIGVIMDFVPVHLRWMRMHWQSLTERRCMSIRIRTLETVSGEAVILCTPVARCAPFYSPVRITG